MAVLGVVSAPAGATAPASITPALKFATLPNPTAVAVTSHQLVALSGNSCSTVYAVAPNGTVSTFATLNTTITKCPETAIAISPGLGNFPAGEVYALLAGHLFEIPAGGSSTPISAALVIKNLTAGNMGLAFDYTGDFGYALLATGGRHGAAVEIDAENHVRSLGSFGVSVEGPAVAPASFGSVGGYLVAAQSFDSKISAMSPTGSVTTFASFGTPGEAVSFIPTIACSFATTGDAYFVADTSGNALLTIPASQFTDLAGSGLVLSEARGTGIGLLRANGTTSSFLKLPGNFEGAAFATCPVGVAQTQDLSSHGLNGTDLNIIGYDPATEQLVGADPTDAPSQIFLLNGTTAGFVQNVSTGLDPASVAYDPCTNTLFVANTGSNNLTLLNASTFQELGNISTGWGSAPVGVAYDGWDQKLYVADSGDDRVTVLSLGYRCWWWWWGCRGPPVEIRLNGEPLGLVADPRDGNVYVVGNVGDSGTVWEINDYRVIRLLTIGNDAQSIAVNNGTGALYVTILGSNETALVSPGDRLNTTVAVPEPVGVAFDPANGLVFVDSEDGNLSVIQGTTVIATYPFGGDPGPLVYDPAANLVYGAADVTLFGLDPRIIIGGSG